MTPQENSDRNHSDDDPMDGGIAIRISQVRLSIAQKATTKTVPIPSILQKSLNKLLDIDNNASFHDILAKPISMEQFPVEKDAFVKAFGTIVPAGRNS
jgi:hypothetical protein